MVNRKPKKNLSLAAKLRIQKLGGPKYMAALAKKRASKMTYQQKQDHATKMVMAREAKRLGW